jgi:hypothetical protein
MDRETRLNLVETAAALGGRIAAEKPASYLESDIPAPMDGTISQLMEAYEAAPAESRTAAADTFEGPWQSLILFAYAARMATTAVRLRQPLAVRLGLRALAFEGARNDWRDTLVYLAVVTDAAERVGLDPAKEIYQAAQLASTSEVRERFHEFASRPPELRTLKTVGWRLTGSGENAQYKSL